MHSQSVEVGCLLVWRGCSVRCSSDSQLWFSLSHLRPDPPPAVPRRTPTIPRVQADLKGADDDDVAFASVADVLAGADPKLEGEDGDCKDKAALPGKLLAARQALAGAMDKSNVAVAVEQQRCDTPSIPESLDTLSCSPFFLSPRYPPIPSSLGRQSTS